MTTDMQQYATTQINKIRTRINNACQAVNRRPENVMLIGASKRQSSELICHFSNNGLSHVGENYLQEAVEKKNELIEQPLTWHFIGQIQSNKTKIIAQNFSWVHGVDRLKIAQRLGQQKDATQADINILIQLNPDNEASKAGVALNDASALCDRIAQTDGVVLRGFMMIPKARELVTDQRKVFSQARELLEQTNQQYSLSMDSLSMGMSTDLEAAISEGSTMIRVGTDLFGARQ